MIELEKIDKVVERTGASYQKAKEALEKTENDVISAIILIEKEKQDSQTQLKIKSKIIIDSIKEILSEGTATNIQIKKGGKTVIDLPIILGAASLIIAPIIAVLGVGAIFIYDYEIYIEKEDKTTIDVIEYTKKKLTQVKTIINKNQ